MIDFDLENEEPVQLSSLRDAFGLTLAMLGKTNSKIVVIDADVSRSTKTVIFAEKFPERFFNVGISEQDMVGVGAGLATCNKIPFVVAFASFLTSRGLDQIRNMVSYSNLNVKFIGTHAGLATGKDGATHQALEDISIMRSIPNMEVYSPSDSIEVIQMIKHMVAKKGPAYMRLPRTDGVIIHEENYIYKQHQIDVLYNLSDCEIVIFATGMMVSNSIQAVKLLQQEGFKVGLVNVHTIKPIDINSIKRILEHNFLIVTVEDHSIIGGLGTSLAEIIAESGCGVKLLRLGIEDLFGESGSMNELYDKHGLTSEKIAGTIIDTSKQMGLLKNNVKLKTQ
ncbi:MAG: transketolase family protein [Candidatus Hodarchaeales archaeon]|jgi:transketolase